MAKQVIVGTDTVNAALITRCNSNFTELYNLLTGVASPTIITPTIASFENATHTHANDAGGGNVITNPLLGNNTVARAYRGSADQTMVDSDYDLVEFNAETYDPGGNFASNVYTAPSDGYYFVACQLYFYATSIANFDIHIYVNGSSYSKKSWKVVEGGIPAVYADELTKNIVDIVPVGSGQTIAIYIYSVVVGTGKIGYGNEKSYLSVCRLSTA